MRTGTRVEEGHTLSQEATEIFESTRAKVARLNLVSRCFEQDTLQAGDEVLVTGAERHSNIIPWMLACRQVGRLCVRHLSSPEVIWICAPSSGCRASGRASSA